MLLRFSFCARSVSEVLGNASLAANGRSSLNSGVLGGGGSLGSLLGRLDEAIDIRNDGDGTIGPSDANGTTRTPCHGGNDRGRGGLDTGGDAGAGELANELSAGGIIGIGRRGLLGNLPNNDAPIPARTEQVVAIGTEGKAHGDVGMALNTIVVPIGVRSRSLGTEEAFLLVILGGMTELDVGSAGDGQPRSIGLDGGMGDLIGHVGTVEGANVGLGDGLVGVLVELLPVQGGVGSGDLPHAETSVEAKGGDGVLAWSVFRRK